MQLPVCINVRNSKVKLISISKKSQISSKIMDRDIKNKKSVIYQKEQPIFPLNFKISKEVTITSITDSNETKNNITLNKLKQLPGITINLVKSEPVFKVPKSPKPKKNITSHNKSKVFFEKKRLSERRDDNMETIDNLLTNYIVNISNTNLKQIPKQVFNNISLITKSSNKEVLKNSGASFENYPVLVKENVHRTCSPKNLSKNVQSFSKVKSKSLRIIKPVEEVSNNCNIFSEEVKKVSDTDKTINNTELKTNKLANEMLMNLSTDVQFNIVRASFPLNCSNVSVPECANFLMGISKSSKDCSMPLKTSQNNTDKGSLMITEKLDNFSDFLGCVNTSLNINESNDIHSEVASVSSNNKIPSFDNFKDEQLCTNNKSKDNIIGKFEDEQRLNSNINFYNYTSKQLSLQHKDMNQTMGTSITQDDNYQLRKMTSYFCNNSLENICKNENKLMDFHIPIPQLLPDNIKNSPNLKSNENESGTKRKQSQNELYKKQKMC